jgi:hypothetical protein
MANNFQPRIPEFQRGERLSAARLNELADAVARLMQTKQSSHGYAFGIVQPLEQVVILDAGLAVATHALTGAASCLATVCRWDIVLARYLETTQQITVWNHSESTSHLIDTFGVARFIDGHWHFFGDCEPMAAR